MAQAQVHFQKKHCTVKESNKCYLSFYCEGQPAHASSPYSTCTSAFPKTTLRRELYIMHDRFPFIVKENTSTSPLPTTKLRHEGEHKRFATNNYIASKNES